MILRFDTEFLRQAAQRSAEPVDRFLELELLQVRPANIDMGFVIELIRIDRTVLESFNAY